MRFLWETLGDPHRSLTFGSKVLCYHDCAANSPSTRVKLDMFNLALIDGLVHIDDNDQWTRFDAYAFSTCRQKWTISCKCNQESQKTLQSLEVASIVKFQQQLFKSSYQIHTAYSSLTILCLSARQLACQVSFSCGVLSIQTFDQLVQMWMSWTEC